MKTSTHMPLVVGIPGARLDSDEREILERVQPSGVILFARNIESADQTRRLVEDLRELEAAPFVAIDLEGGMVNRFSSLWGELPTPAESGKAGRRAIRALGEAAGAACRNLGVHLDLAPVVDLECPGGCLGHQGRCFSDDPERVIVLAKLFNQGLSTWGVTGCSKHFPGLGQVPVDTHEELPVLDLDEDELARQLGVFEALGPEFPAVMMAHVVVPGLGEKDRPASLSRTMVEMAAALPGSPVVLSDDLEMGALNEWGDLPERVEAALSARNHGILVCKAFDRLEDIVRHLNELGATDSKVSTRVTEMAARMGTLRTEVCQRFAAVPAPDETTVAQLWERARKEAAP
jgi:beta-N-acetylhexosaminidase